MGLVVGEDRKWILNLLHVALPKHEMGHIFWVTVVEDSLTHVFLSMHGDHVELSLTAEQAQRIRPFFELIKGGGWQLVNPAAR